MQIEHIAYQVEHPAEVAAWYVRHLGFQVKRAFDEGPRAHFLADSSGRVMIEIYNNPKVAVPDYAAMDPLLLHLAFISADPAGDRDRLLGAGDGEDHLVMLRDPWGFALQLCKRAQPMV